MKQNRLLPFTGIDRNSKLNKMGIKGKILIITMIILCGCETKENGFEYVDLGLPSGTLWATCNVGAEHPYDVGDYFAWGETQPKERFGWDNYKYISSDSTMTKYVFYPKSPYYDTLRILEPCDDAATANMGGRWVTPTYSEFLELRMECDHYDTDNYKGSGISGTIFTSKHNGKSIFLPRIMEADNIEPNKGIHELYWSSNLCFDEELIDCDDEGKPYIRKSHTAVPGDCIVELYRFYGSPVRGVIRGNNVTDWKPDTFKVDPVEYSPAYKAIICDVMEEVVDSITLHLGKCSMNDWDWGSSEVWYYQKKVLKRHGIDWKSPEELNHIEY